MRRVLARAAAGVAVGALSACSLIAPADRGGVDAETVLRWGYPSETDAVQERTASFRDAVVERTGGAVATELVEVGEDGAATARAVVDGAVDGALVPTRYLAELGVPGFDVLEAPLVVTNGAAQDAVTQPAMAQEFLPLLEGSGLVGIGLLPGELRRPVATERALLGPRSWLARPLRAIDAAQARAMRAWGATPVEQRVSLTSAISAGLVDGGETDLPSQLHAADLSAAPFMTGNVVLWPKTWILLVREERWHALDQAQRDALVAAAEDARHDAVSAPPDENVLAARLCGQGARFPAASAEEVDQLRAATAGVLDELRRDPRTGPLLTAVQQAVSSTGGTATIEVADSCRDDPVLAPRLGVVPTTPSELPAGTYRMHLSSDDIVTAGVGRPEEAQTVTLTIRSDGTYRIESRFDDGQFMVFEEGRVTGRGNVAYFVNDRDALTRLRDSGTPACVWPDGGCGTNTQPYSVVWTVGDGGRVRFSDQVGMDPDPLMALAMLTHPFVRID